MGYTHYFSLPRRAGAARWSPFTNVIRHVLSHPAFERQLAFEHDEPTRPPQIDERIVRFNGIGRNGYETFLFENKRASEARGFCKTGFSADGDFRVYDVAVCTTLIVAHELLHADVSSDGEWFSPGWVLARAVYAEVVGSVPSCPWSTRACASCDLPFSPALADDGRCWSCANSAKDDGARARRESHAALRMLRKMTGRKDTLARGWNKVMASADLVPVTEPEQVERGDSLSPRK